MVVAAERAEVNLPGLTLLCKDTYFTALCSDSEAGSYLRLISLCFRSNVHGRMVHASEVDGSLVNVIHRMLMFFLSSEALLLSSKALPFS